MSVGATGASGRQRAPGETHARLVEAAEARFAERGYAATSIQQICRSAEVSIGSFYHHFDDKAALTTAVLERAHARFAGTFADVDPARPHTIESAVTELLEGPHAGVDRALREAIEVEPRLGDAAASARAVIHRRLYTAVRASRADDDSEYAVDAASLAWTLLSLVRDAVARRDGPSARTIATVISYCAAARATKCPDPAR